MDNRDIRRNSLKNFVYAGAGMEVDSSVCLGMAYRYRQKMKKVPKAIRRRGREAYTQYEDHPISCVKDLGRVAFADEFLYYVSNDNPVLSHNVSPKTETNVIFSCIDPNSADGCNIDLADVVVDVAAIPEPSKNYIFSRRCRELALRIVLPLLMLFALPMMNSCKDKEDDPVTPPTPQPDPTDTIVIPTKEKTFDIDWNVEPYDFAPPPADSIKKYASDLEYKYVFINFMDLRQNQEGMPCDGTPVRIFKRARDTLQTRIDINPKKVLGTGIIIAGNVGDASWPEDVSGTKQGMRAVDSAWFAANGWEIKNR
ncbi:MAG: hypothetical protein J5542_05710 [Bacteroidales bacterium]|nr:hypothetical protein [Bacteroidales bacterium]